MAKSEKKPSALDRAIAQAVGDGRTLGADADTAREKYPAVWEWMSRVYIGTDKVRTPASVTISLGPTGVLVRIADRDLMVSCGASCEFLDDALSALEKALTADVPPIVSWGKKEPRLRKRGN